MNYRLDDLSSKLGLEFKGRGDIIISHATGIDNIRPGGLAYITDPKELAGLPTPKGIFSARKTELDEIEIPPDAALIVPASMASDNHNLILSDDPMLHHSEAAALLHRSSLNEGVVHPAAVLGRNVTLGDNVTIEAHAVIYDNVRIGSGSVIHAGVVIMQDCSIGEDCLIYPNVTLRERCTIGNRVILHPGVVLGADGYGFFQRDGKNLKLPQVGTVVVEDDVEIGACTTVDRARFHQTVIHRGSKLDNLIHIAHNVELGEDSLMAAQSGIAGSTTVGHHLMMGGQSGIKDNLKVGNKVTLLARTLITSKTEDNAVVAGMPSRPIKVWRQIQALINSLDSLFERLKKLEARVDKNERQERGKV